MALRYSKSQIVAQIFFKYDIHKDSLVSFTSPDTMPGSNVDRDDSSGQFTSNTRSEVYEAMPLGEPTIASEIAEKSDLPRTTVNYHLNDLAEAGKIMKKKFHERRVVWMKY